MSDGFADEDALEQALPGSRLVHMLNFTTSEALATAIAVLRAVHAAGGRIEALSIRPSGGALDHRLCLAGLRSSEARALAEHLSELPEVRGSRIEHHVLRRAAAPPLTAEPRASRP